MYIYDMTTKSDHIISELVERTYNTDLAIEQWLIWTVHSMNTRHTYRCTNNGYVIELFRSFRNYITETDFPAMLAIYPETAVDNHNRISDINITEEEFDLLFNAIGQQVDYIRQLDFSVIMREFMRIK